LQRQVITTNDGSTTIKVLNLNECYHSTFGAITESQHIYIEAGLKFVSSKKSEISVMEVGFGTGLNALLACIFAYENKNTINYLGIEPYPIKDEEFNLLNYGNFLHHEKTLQWFEEIFKSRNNVSTSIHPLFNFTKEVIPIQDWKVMNEAFDVIFFDAFAPEVQPEMWQSEIFEKLYAALKMGGIMVTYCCKGIVKRRLKESGFTIEKLPGPPGKREIIRAMKK
jgi:tRNA U34 5-methylaminomethyl-2-thiouridine-forming methyltransferase MnmC